MSPDTRYERHDGAGSEESQNSGIVTSVTALWRKILGRAATDTPDPMLTWQPIAMKTEYVPAEDARFRIAQDHYSHLRKHTVHAMLASLRREYPLRMAMTLFGSLSKGKVLDSESAQHTDVDLACFFDAEDADRSRKHLIKHHADFREQLLADPQRDHIRVMGRLLFNKMKQRLHDRFPLKDDGKHHVQVYPIAMTGKFSPLERIERLAHFHSREARDYGRMDNEECVARLFHLDIENGLRSYRHKLFTSLATMGSQGQRYWAMVDGLVRMRERGNVIPEAIAAEYPSTVDDALAYYSQTQVAR